MVDMTWLIRSNSLRPFKKIFNNKYYIVEEFNKLVQNRGGMGEYVKRFKQMKSLINALNPSFPEFYHIFSVITGLREDIKLITLM